LNASRAEPTVPASTDDFRAMDALSPAARRPLLSRLLVASSRTVSTSVGRMCEFEFWTSAPAKSSLSPSFSLAYIAFRSMPGSSMAINCCGARVEDVEVVVVVVFGPGPTVLLAESVALVLSTVAAAVVGAADSVFSAVLGASLVVVALVLSTVAAAVVGAADSVFGAVLGTSVVLLVVVVLTAVVAGARAAVVTVTVAVVAAFWILVAVVLPAVVVTGADKVLTSLSDDPDPDPSTSSVVGAAVVVVVVVVDVDVGVDVDVDVDVVLVVEAATTCVVVSTAVVDAAVAKSVATTDSIANVWLF